MSNNTHGESKEVKVIKNTDFSINDQRLAFNKLVNKKDTRFINILYDMKYLLEINVKCLYCHRDNNCKYIKFFGNFCNFLCHDLYFNLYDYNLDTENKNLRLPQISFFKEKELIYKLLDDYKDKRVIKLISVKQSIGEVLIKLSYISDTLDTLKTGKNEINEISLLVKTHEYSNKKLVNLHNLKCLYCNSVITEKPKFIKTFDKTFIGCFDSFMCKVSYSYYINKFIKIEKLYSFHLIDNEICPTSLNNIKKIIQDKKKIINGYNGLNYEDGKYYLHIKIMSEQND